MTLLLKLYLKSSIIQTAESPIPRSILDDLLDLLCFTNGETPSAPQPPDVRHHMSDLEAGDENVAKMTEWRYVVLCVFAYYMKGNALFTMLLIRVIVGMFVLFMNQLFFLQFLLIREKSAIFFWEGMRLNDKIIILK